ncbi:MAG TPA: thioredoxin family protein [Thermoanaerobaculia bacterium]|jgi:thiol:disulfide interchange protein|nr:thioredoxin family protein [Thermoanaerobaculia bacterium]
MARIEMPETPEGFPLAAESPRPAGAGSQSKIPSLLFLVLVAAALFRIVTAAIDRGTRDEGGGLVRWTAGESAAATARASGKPILYDFTAEWCGPCKMLDANGWSDPEVAALVNASYVPARVVDRMREEGKNPAWIDELQRRYGVGAFPTLVIAGPDGKAIAVAQGFAGKPNLVEFLRGPLRKADSPAPPNGNPP